MASITKKIRKMGDKRVVITPKDVYDYFKPNDLVKVTKVNRNEYNCPKCGKKMCATSWLETKTVTWKDILEKYCLCNYSPDDLESIKQMAKKENKK